MVKIGLSIFLALLGFVSSWVNAADSLRELSSASNVAEAINAVQNGQGQVFTESLPVESANGWFFIRLETPHTSIVHFPSNSVTRYSVYSYPQGELVDAFVSPFQSATHIDWNPRFTLAFERTWGDEFIIQLTMISTGDIPFSFMSFESYRDLLSDQLIKSGVFYGAIGLMTLISLLLFLLNKDKNAGRLSFSLLIWLLTMLSIWGFGSSPMPLGLSSILPSITNQLTITGSLAGAWFSLNFLRQSIANSPIIKALQISIRLHLGYLLVSFFIAPIWTITILVNIISGLVCLAAAALAVARGDKPARFLLASSILVSSPFFFIFISPFNQQTIIAVGIATLVFVMLALLKRIAEQTESWAQKADMASERERFLASMSHEIRTPLNGIIGFSELANQEHLEGNVKTYFNQIDRSSKVLLGIVNEVLDYAKLQATEIKPNFGPFNIREALADVVTINQPTATKNSIELSVEVDDNLPNYVTTDPQRCLQILINLCGNAVKFSKNGRVLIRASREDSQLVFKVIDNGIGIHEDVLAGLFNPFKQADAATARQFGGTGLGLAISKQLCLLLGGSLSAVSEYGKGSTFTLSLPFKKADEPATENSVNGDFLIGKRVLVAEDNPINLMLATQILKKHGLEIDSAEDGQIALEMASKNAYDYILMDMQMPELSGTEATTEIRKLGLTMPIIAMTANTSKSDREACLSAGMNDYLSKPIEQQQLLQKLTLWATAN